MSNSKTNDINVASLVSRLQKQPKKEQEVKKEYEPNPYMLRMPSYKEGETNELKIRVLPNPNNEGTTPITRIPMNYKLGKYAPIPSLKEYFGTSDPLADYSQEIFGIANTLAKQKGIDKDREAKKKDHAINSLFKLAYKYTPTDRYYCPVVPRNGDQAGKIVYWGFSEKMWEQLQTQFKELGEDEIPFGRYSGYDITVVPSKGKEVVGDGGEKVVIPEYTVTLARKVTPCLPGKSNEEIDAFIETVPTIEKVFLDKDKKDYDQVSEIVDYLRNVNEPYIQSLINPGQMPQGVTSSVAPQQAKQVTSSNMETNFSELDAELEEQLG